MTSADDEQPISLEERALIGSVMEGRVIAAFRWGLILDLGLSHVGFVDVLYTDDGRTYVPGDLVRGHVTDFHEQMAKFWLRPLGQLPIAERYTQIGGADDAG